MINHNDSFSSSRLYESLAMLGERDDDLFTLDTNATRAADGSVHLQLTQLDGLRQRLVGRPEDDWWQLLDRCSDATPEGEALTETVSAGIGAISLTREAVYQQTTNRPSAERIMVHERDRYGHLYSDELFTTALIRKRDQMIAVNLDNAPQAAAVRDQLVAMFESVIANGPDVELYDGPRPETLRDVRQWFGNHERYKGALEYITDDKEEYGPAEIRDVCAYAIENDPLLARLGWRCEPIERQTSAMTVFSARRLAVVPNNHRSLDAQCLRGILAHEIFNHVGRSANAEAAGFQLGRTGTTSYMGFEESFGIALEQCFEGEYEPFIGTILYVSVGLGMQAMGSTLNLSEVVDSIKAQHHITMACGQERDLTEEELAQAEQASLAIVGRICQGMHTDARGAVHMRDLTYFSNSETTWRLLDWISQNDCVDAAMTWLLSGKFNPFSATDRAVMGSYAQPPKALEEYLSSLE